MTQSSALHTAIALFREPTRVKYARTRDLPHDVAILLRIVSGDERAIEEAVQLSQRPADFAIAAAEFFIEQILFAPNSDSYRALGAGPDAPRETLRAHMVMLLKWLHPDAAPAETRAVLAVRVTKAWNNLKTQERRAAYDASLPEVTARTLLRRAASIRRAQDPRGPKPVPRQHPRHADTSRPSLDGIAPPSMPIPAPPKPQPPSLLAMVLGFFQAKLKGV